MLHECDNIICDIEIIIMHMVDAECNLKYIVLRQDCGSHKKNATEVLDKNMSYVVGAVINTRDYSMCVHDLVDAGEDVISIDCSEVTDEMQTRIIDWISELYGDTVKVGASNVEDHRGTALPRNGRR
jgi:IMP dehydrogenase / GMP reductase domain.